jgi:hypothetical protein
MDHLLEAVSAFLARPERRGRLATALTLLRDAWDAAQDVQRNPWHFAVKVEEFWAAGVADSYLLWLIARGYAVCAREKPPGPRQALPGCRGRRLRLSGGTRLVLSSSGLRFAAMLLDAHPVRPAALDPAEADPADGALRPHWSGDVRELYWNGILVKQFRVPAWSQELILAAFQEEGWPAHLDDPLPQSEGVDPKERLRNAIKGLNRNQKNVLLHFEGDGNAQGVVWRRLQPAAAPAPDCTRRTP